MRKGPVLRAVLISLILLSVMPARVMAESGPDSSMVPARIIIREPLAGSLFPPDLASPLFRWTDPLKSLEWMLKAEVNGKEIFSRQLDRPWWVPEPEEWARIRDGAGLDRVEITLSGINVRDGATVQSRGDTHFAFSRDPLEARIMFMRKPLPFARALDNPEQTQLLAADPESYAPPENILQHPPVCANCHSYSRDGSVLALDTDFRGDKGGFLLTPNSGEIVVDQDNVHSWNKIEATRPALYSMGLFAAVSPEGKQVAATISETSVFVMMDDIYFSQLFFPATGEIAVFDAEAGSMTRLPGASRKDMIQTAPAWSPDGRTLAFSRAPVDPGLVQKVLDKTVLGESNRQKIFELNKKYPVQFDIYTLDLDDQKNPAVPLKGASGNGCSNYFPRYSPDGKWIVFTRSPTGLVLQPDSRLFIVPARGGRARELAANQPVMNSWHSWSPNSRWLVFTSKAESAFTELYLTHINEQGKSSPAVRLFRLSSNDMAAMVPEFIPRGALIPESVSFAPGSAGESMAVDGR